MKTTNTPLKWLAVAGIAGLAAQANAASISQGAAAFLHSQNNGLPGGENIEHDISVFAGSAGFAGSDASGNSTSGTFGDGTVTAYNFWTVDAGGDALNNGNEFIVSYAESGGLITGDTTDTFIEGASATDLWETTDPVGFTTTADFFTGTNATGLTDFSGSIDISSLASGSIYFMFGHYRGGNAITSSVTLTMLDGVTDVLGGPVSVTANDTANNWEHYMVEATFVNDVGATSIDYNFNFIGNGRISGIVIDGVTVPEPSSAALLGLGALGLLVRRRR